MSDIIEEYAQMDGPTILMVDEVLPMTSDSRDNNVTYDWSSLKLSNKVDVIMAVSPSSGYSVQDQQFQVIPPCHPNIFTLQLKQKYRNFAELDRLLSCLKRHHKDLTSGE